METPAALDGRSTRWAPHREERRQAIIAAAVAAVEQYGPDVLTAQIAEQAGVPRTHVYRHFDGKRALDLAVSAHIGHEIGERIRAGLATGGSPREVIAAAVDQHLAWVEAHPNLYRFVAQHAYAVRSRDSEGAAVDAKAIFAREIGVLVQRYAEALGVDASRAERVVVGVVGLVDATAAWWLEQPDLPRSELTAELTDHVWLLIGSTVGELGGHLDPDAPLPDLPSPG